MKNTKPKKQAYKLKLGEKILVGLAITTGTTILILIVITKSINPNVCYIF